MGEEGVRRNEWLEEEEQEIGHKIWLSGKYL